MLKDTCTDTSKNVFVFLMENCVACLCVCLHFFFQRKKCRYLVFYFTFSNANFPCTNITIVWLFFCVLLALIVTQEIQCISFAQLISFGYNFCKPFSSRCVFFALVQLSFFWKWEKNFFWLYRLHSVFVWCTLESKKPCIFFTPFLNIR